MYRVTTSGGFSFVCKELDDAVVLADNLLRDSDQESIVIDELVGNVVYETRK